MSLLRRMQESLGTVVPIWFPESVAVGDMADLLRRVTSEIEAYSQPGNVLLVVDGCPHAVEATEIVAGEVGERCGEKCRVEIMSENQGKGGAVARGLELLLLDPGIELLVARDHDGDHDVHDLPRIVRRFADVIARERTDNVFAVGSRVSPQMGLGWARGEYELLLNRALVEAVNVALAADGRRVDLRYSLPETRYPDFQSGYKLYTRRTAQANIDIIRAAHEADPETRVMYWGGEFVTATELLLRGAIPVEVSRATYDEQPHTTFDERDRVEAFGKQFAWLFRRLDTPAEMARLITDNAIAQSPLRFAAGLWDELMAFREYVRSAAYPDADWSNPPPHGELL
ncbi:MAG TPA: hypothetical protein QGH10_08300 [Armatimonadota bacterium]|nr:hypothetical protein [Armatimonadota bacterium]